VENTARGAQIVKEDSVCSDLAPEQETETGGAPLEAWQLGNGARPMRERCGARWEGPWGRGGHGAGAGAAQGQRQGGVRREGEGGCSGGCPLAPGPLSESPSPLTDKPPTPLLRHRSSDPQDTGLLAAARGELGRKGSAEVEEGPVCETGAEFQPEEGFLEWGAAQPLLSSAQAYLLHRDYHPGGLHPGDASGVPLEREGSAASAPLPGGVRGALAPAEGKIRQPLLPLCSLKGSSPGLASLERGNSSSAAAWHYPAGTPPGRGRHPLARGLGGRQPRGGGGGWTRSLPQDRPPRQQGTAPLGPSSGGCPWVHHRRSGVRSPGGGIAQAGSAPGRGRPPGGG